MMRSVRICGSKAIFPRFSFHSSIYSKMAKVLATDDVDECCVKLFQQRGHQCDVIKTLPEAELCKIIGQYDGLVVRSATKVIIL